MAGGPSLLEAFVDALAPEVRDAWRSTSDLEPALARAIARATPLAPCPAPDPALHVAAIAVAIGDRPASAATIDELDSAALALAQACAAGDHGAIAAFREAYFDDIDKAIGRTRAPAHLVDDIRQIVLAKLLPPGRRLARFGGRGDLRNWVRAVAVREAISAIRATAGELVRDELPLELAGPANPERSAIRGHAQERLTAGLQAAFADLDDEDRTVLRYRFTDGLTLDQLALVLGVHRATAARWLARIRDDLARGVRRRLEHAGVARAEIDGLLAVSNLELSLGGLLA